MTAGASLKGGFFSIDARIWAKAITLGMNEAVAYLVHACGTGRNNEDTSWSTNAVMKYAGIGHIRAKLAIERLIAGGFTRFAEKHTASNPRYRLATILELTDHEASENTSSVTDYLELKLLADMEAGKQPRGKSGQALAGRLCSRGLLCRDAQGIYRLPEPFPEDSGNNLIWLPNTIVTGTKSGEASPVRRLRSAGCVWTLRLFVDLYSSQNLRDDGGISRCLIWQVYERQRIGQQGPYTILGFKPDQRTRAFAGPFVAHEIRQRAKPEGNSPVWESLNLLESLGLLSFVPYIFENDTDVAEPIHVYGVGGTAEAPIEREIGAAADCSARAMALPAKLEEAEGAGFEYFCPVLRTMPGAQMVGVARLTYRPRTRRTKAWFAELQLTAQVWIKLFRELAAKGEESSSQRAANFF